MTSNIDPTGTGPGTVAFTVHSGYSIRHRCEAAALYWAAFSGKLGRILRPERKAMALLVRVLDPSYAFSAIDADGNLLGVAGFKTRQGAFLSVGLRDLAKSYGWFGALWRGVLLDMLERPDQPRLLLMDGIFVRESARGLGVGSALLDRIVDEARDRRLDGVRLDVIDANPRARALYERKGFEPAGTEQMGPFRYLLGFRSATTMIRQVRG